MARLAGPRQLGQFVQILSLQSQVVWGHVGNSVAAFALQRLGLDVLAVPTAIFSHHPGHGPPAGRALAADEITAFCQSLHSHGLMAQCAGVLTGWAGSAAVAEAASLAAQAVKAANAWALWLCDPVLGDDGKGLYVAPELVEVYREAAARADILTPNRFELECLTGQSVQSEAEALAALDTLLARGTGTAICTGLLTGEGEIATIAARADGAIAALTPRLDGAPKGAGDLLAALLLGRLCQGADLERALKLSVGAVFDILRLSVEARSPELALVAGQDAILAPSCKPKIRRLR